MMGGGAGGGGATRMLVTLPIIFYSSSIDWENHLILTGIRLAYVVMTLTHVLLLWLSQQAVEKAQDVRRIKVPEVQPGLMGPSGPPVVKKTTYHAYEMEKSSQGMQQAVIGMAMMAFFSFKMGIHVPILLQAAMAPFTIYESPLIRKHVFGMNKDNAWKETVIAEGEESEEEEETPEGGAVEDAAANAGAGGGDAKPAPTGVDLEVQNYLMEVWDTRISLDAGKLSAMLKRGSSINFQTSDSQWTPLMVACGATNSDGTEIAALLDMGADPLLADNEGWTAFHWASYHNVLPALQQLLAKAPANAVAAGLTTTDINSMTPLELAKQEKNAGIVAALEALDDTVPRPLEELEGDAEAVPEEPVPAASSSPAGLRQRQRAADADDDGVTGPEVEDLD